MKYPFFKEVLFLAILISIIALSLQIMGYDLSFILFLVGGALALISYILAIIDLHSMKGIPPNERFIISLIILAGNFIGLIIYSFYRKILRERSDRNILEKDERWKNLLDK